MALWLYVRFKLMPMVAQIAFVLFTTIMGFIAVGALYLLFT
jgi:hypothetical protein